MRDLRLKGYDIYRFGGTQFINAGLRCSCSTASSTASPPATPYPAGRVIRLVVLSDPPPTDGNRPKTEGSVYLEHMAR
jgi:hypothetical protein